jgi:hypothetical protein
VFAVGHVEGGTNAGRRVVKPPRKRWFCNCEGSDGMKLNPGYLARCPDCGSRRDGRVDGRASFAEASVANEALNR